MPKIKRAEWEITITPEPGDRWPIISHAESGFDLDPQEIDIGFDAIEGGTPVLLPIEVSGTLVHNGQPVTPGVQEMSVRLLEPWLAEIVAQAAKALGVGDYTTEGENHDRRRGGLRSVE